MPNVSVIRLNMLRAGYLLLVVGLGSVVWPSILNTAKTWELMHGIEVSMLGALGLLSVLGLRYPLRMLPLLFWELAWKMIWLGRVALPLWATHRLDADTAVAAGQCLTVVIFVFLIPWSYVYQRYIREPAEPWSRRHAFVAAE